MSGSLRTLTPRSGAEMLAPDLEVEFRWLEQRLGVPHARRRLRIENDHEARIRWQRLHFGIEATRLTAIAIKAVLKASGMYGRGERNAERLMVRLNPVNSAELPQAFEGFAILHLSDLHCDMSGRAMASLGSLLSDLRYDICVLTGDFRGATYGPFENALTTLADLRAKIRSPVYGVLGNHDSARMLSRLEAMGIRMLMNESETIMREGQRIHIVGIDDAHLYRTHDIEEAAASIPHDEFSIMLSHTPEVYHQAARAGVDLLLAGHTHGGQICLPGGIPVTLMSKMPRRFGSGAWQHLAMQGYTSVGAGTGAVPARFNCAPEITLHRLGSVAV